MLFFYIAKMKTLTWQPVLRTSKISAAIFSSENRHVKEFVLHLWPRVFYLWVCLNAKLLHASFTSFDFWAYPNHFFYWINLQVKLVIRNIGNIFTFYSEIFLSERVRYSTSCMTDFVIELFNSFDYFNSLPTNAGSQLHSLTFNRRMSICL